MSDSNGDDSIKLDANAAIDSVKDIPYLDANAAIDSVKDIPYLPDVDPSNPLRMLDSYFPAFSNPSVLPPLFVFVHGGAWRAEDKSIHAPLAIRLASSCNCAVAVLNYRLSSNNTANPGYGLTHPAHTEDLLAALEFLIAQPQKRYDAQRVVLAGHSCSAHMLACIFLDSGEASLLPSSALKAAVKGIMTTEGIYSLSLLLDSFPAYRDWFIADAFGPGPSYTQFDAASFNRRDGGGPRWMILHSKGDTLVDEKQSEEFARFISGLYGETRISKHFDLEEEHDDVLKQARYIELAKDFVATCVQ